MKTLRLVLVLACCAGTCTDGPAVALDVSLRFSPTPPSVGPARLLLELTDSLGGPVTGASLQIEARPTGEPARRTISARAREESAGRYVVDGYEFDVSGRWILNIRARTIEGSELARDFETEVYGGSPGAGPGR